MPKDSPATTLRPIALLAPTGARCAHRSLGTLLCLMLFGCGSSDAGNKTNKNVGTFAGMTDVQGIDLYVAACAPWICTFGPPPLRAAYDYLRNTRNNHMPWPTWQYAQGMSSWPGQPEPHEILVQSFSVMAAGGKGLMWFQSPRELADDHPATWHAMARSNFVFRALRSRLRVGDLTGAASTTGDALVEMIRADDALVIPVISLASSSGPTLATCGAAGIGLPVPHWKLTDQTLDLSLRVPDDFPVADAFEILVDDSAPDQVVDLAYPGWFDGREVSFQGLTFSEATPVRVIVLAADASVRVAVTDALVP